MYNLLKDPVPRVDKVDGSRHLATLPEVYAALMADEVVAFPACRAHHRHAWHAFLCQVGAMAVHEAGLSQPPDSAGAWLRILRGLTPDHPGDEPWTLVVDDNTTPAFMQPPARTAAGQSDYRSDEIISPDDLDLVITTKNHEDKKNVAIDAEVDDWVVTLVALQTMEGYRGTGNYGISRMKGGFGSRPAFSLAPLNPHPGAHVRRDIVALLEARTGLLEAHPMVEGGVRLMWTVPWDGHGDEALHLSDLDPLYVEVCRRIRLRTTSSGRAIRAVKAGTEQYRVTMRETTDPSTDRETRTGLTGDPWTPFKTGDNGGALTLREDGFSYRRITACLTEWEHPHLLRPTQAELDSPPPMRLVARAMARGRGTSGGYHERSIPLSHRAVSELAADVPAGGTLGEIARHRVQLVSVIQGILNRSIQVCRSGGRPRKPGAALSRIEQMRPWRTALNRSVDTHFFDDLQRELAAEAEAQQEVRRQWLLGVVDDARQILRHHLDSLPCPAGRQLRSMEEATSLFEASVRRHEQLSLAYPRNGGGHEEPARKEDDVTDGKADSPADGGAPGEHRRQELADAAVSIAGELATEWYPRGDLARLRRMDPDNPGPSAFWDLLAKRGLSFGPDLEARWALIVHGIALMTPLNRKGEEFQTAHDGYVPVGRALFTGGNPLAQGRPLRCDAPRSPAAFTGARNEEAHRPDMPHDAVRQRPVQLARAGPLHSGRRT